MKRCGNCIVYAMERIIKARGDLMNKNISAIAIKLFGIYIGFSFIRLTPSLLVIFLIDTTDFMQDKLTYSIINIAYLLIYLVVSFLFIFKTQLVLKIFRFPDENKEDIYENLKPFALSLGLILIGLYFLLSSLPYLILYVMSLLPETVFTAPYTGAIGLAQ
jgi:hypothetical protein